LYYFFADLLQNFLYKGSDNRDQLSFCFETHRYDRGPNYFMKKNTDPFSSRGKWEQSIKKQKKKSRKTMSIQRR